MTVHLTEAEFQGLGLTIDPTDPSRAVPIAAQSDSLPDETWDLDRLARYASTGLAEAARLEHESIQIGRRSTVQIFRSGQALSIARSRLRSEGRGRWGRWLNEHGIKRTTAWEAAELFERAGSEEEVAGLTPGEAKSHFGVTRPPKEEADDPGDYRPPGPSPTAITGMERVLDEGNDEEPRSESCLIEEPKLESNRLVYPPRTVREVLTAVCSLLLECERRKDEIDARCIPLVAEIREISLRLPAEVQA